MLNGDGIRFFGPGIVNQSACIPRPFHTGFDNEDFGLWHNILELHPLGDGFVKFGRFDLLDVVRRQFFNERMHGGGKQS